MTDSYSGSTEKCNYMLVDFNGKVISPTFEASIFSLPQSDDMRVLKNGAAVWAFVNSTNNLKVFLY